MLKVARRGRGEGSIYRRDDGTWVAVIHLGWHDGKRRRKYYYARTRAEVRDKYRKAQRALEEGRSLGDDRQKVGQYLGWWLAEALPGTVRDTTVVSYRGALRSNVVPHIGHIRLSKLTPQHVQAMLTAIQDKGLSARTAKYAHAVLRRALGQAERWGMVTRNVAKLVEPPKAVRPEVRSLKPDEVHKLLDAARDDRFEAILTVAIAVGLRRGEALGLKWSDIDLDAAVVRVRRALVYVDGDLRFVDPKTKRSRRTIPCRPSRSRRCGIIGGGRPPNASPLDRTGPIRISCSRQQRVGRWIPTTSAATSAPCATAPAAAE